MSEPPAVLHERVGLLAQLGARSDCATQHVAGGDVGDSVDLDESGRLGALACPWRRTHQRNDLPSDDPRQRPRHRLLFRCGQRP